LFLSKQGMELKLNSPNVFSVNYYDCFCEIGEKL